MKLRAAATGVVTVLAMLVGCSATRDSNLLTVFGASSLATALDDMVDVYSPSGSPPSFAVSTGASSTLRTQIEQGAHADVFLSADTANAQAVADAALTDGPPVAIATNRLTIVVPRGNPAGIESPLDLGRANVRIIAAGEEVPISKYAGEAVAKLATLPGYPADFVAAYQSNIVSREDNVGAVTAKIALGEGDAAIVYVTDAQTTNLETVEIPAEGNVTATYAGVVLKSTTGPRTAHAFIDWVRGPEGQEILVNHGFSPAP